MKGFLLEDQSERAKTLKVLVDLLLLGESDSEAKMQKRYDMICPTFSFRGLRWL